MRNHWKGQWKVGLKDKGGDHYRLHPPNQVSKPKSPVLDRSARSGNPAEVSLSWWGLLGQGWGGEDAHSPSRECPSTRLSSVSVQPEMGSLSGAGCREGGGEGKGERRLWVTDWSVLDLSHFSWDFVRTASALCL